VKFEDPSNKFDQRGTGPARTTLVSLSKVWCVFRAAPIEKERVELPYKWGFIWMNNMDYNEIKRQFRVTHFI